MTSSSDGRGDTGADVTAALQAWRKAAAAVGRTSADHPYYDDLVAARDEAHARYVEVLKASLQMALAAREDAPLRVTSEGLIGDPMG